VGLEVGKTTSGTLKLYRTVFWGYATPAEEPAATLNMPAASTEPEVPTSKLAYPTGEHIPPKTALKRLDRRPPTIWTLAAFDKDPEPTEATFANENLSPLSNRSEA
jgi:hypothetical protein